VSRSIVIVNRTFLVQARLYLNCCYTSSSTTHYGTLTMRPRTIRPRTMRPRMKRLLDDLSPGRSVPWTIHPLEDPSPGRSVPWTIRPLDDPSPGRSIPVTKRPHGNGQSIPDFFHEMDFFGDVSSILHLHRRHYDPRSIVHQSVRAHITTTPIWNISDAAPPPPPGRR
jgi:hypothetical protein